MSDVISRKVLIVDDSPVDLKMLKNILQVNYQILEASDGQSALDMIAKDSPDLVILDIQMPGLDGFEVSRHLTMESKSVPIPFIFMTASTDMDSKIKGFELGAADYITKPITPEDVKARVKAHLKIKELEEERFKRVELERKKTEQEKQSLAEKLTHADKQLGEFSAQMIQAEKMAVIGEITAGVAHELNQPLNVVKIICQSIMKDIERQRFDLESAKQDLPEILNQMNRMALIVDHMRVFSRRSDSNTVELVNVNEAINNVFIFLEQQLKTHNITVDRQCPSDLPKVNVDPIRLEQVFMNLITNARQALESTRKPGMKIEIKCYAVDQKKSVVIDIKDNGPGCPPEIKERIFEPFFSTKEAGKGTGLGLSIAKKIVEQYQGTVVMESVVGESTLFRVTLPAAV